MEQIPTETFADYMGNARNKFVNAIQQQKWNTELRTSAEDILIAYDQMRKRIEKCEGKDEQLKESLLLYNNQTATIIKLEKECEGKEKEIVQIQEAIDRAANILDEKGKQIFLLNKDLLESLRVNSEQSQRISELEAENEKLIMLTRKLLNK